MNSQRVSGYWMVVLTTTAAAAMAAWFQGESLHASPLVRVLVVLLIGALLFSARGLLMGIWRWTVRHAPHRVGDQYARDPAARVGATRTPAATSSADGWQVHVKNALKDRHGWRWRYRQPWLLLTGHDQTIARLLPDLTTDGYLVTDEVVLLWHACDKQGHLDEVWLKQLYKLRRRRPIDGIVLAVDGVADQFAATRGLPGSAVNLTHLARTLHWSAPVVVLDVAQTWDQRDDDAPLTGCEFAPSSQAKPIEENLLALRDQLARLGVQRLARDATDDYTAQLSLRLDTRSAVLAAWIASLVVRRVQVLGAFFTPFPAKANEVAEPQAFVLSPLWPHLGQLTRRDRGRRVGMHPITVACAIALTCVGLWAVGMGVSAFANAQAIHRSQEVVQSLNHGDEAAQLRALLALQQRISLYEERLRHPGTRLHGFGLNQDKPTLAALWERYATASRAVLTLPVQLSLASALADLDKVRADALQDHDAQRRDYNQLKAYLMLAEPARVDAPFLAEQITAAWPVVTAMPPGEWQDTSQRLARFYADHLKAHPEWRIESSTELASSARATLINQIGLANAEDTLYQSVVERVRGKYADVSLPSLLNGTNAQGLFTTSATVPGLYTRAAWEGMVAEAIDKAASERRVEGDWVLTDSASAAAPPADTTSGDDLKQRLTARYFADYAAAWQQMLNSVQWQPAANLNEAIDQLTRLTDAQTSPLLALMKSVQYQAQTGRPSQALGDTLVRRAQNLIGKDDKVDGPVVNPLDASFGPLLALMGDSNVSAGRDTSRGGGSASIAMSGVSLQGYLTAAITMRLKLQQMGNSPDAQAMARAAAQAVFQGKLSDLAQVREQAALTSASLGAAWAGFGDALFTRPLDGAWQTILQPAAASLNEVWRENLAAPFNGAFNGRYPFYDTSADASFAELGRYVRPDVGLIHRFLTTELAGVLTQQGDHWVANGLAPQTLAFDPAFLKAAQQMSVLGARLYSQGDASFHFEIMPLPTPNVTRSDLTIDKQKVTYFNQQETWAPIAWPGDGLNGHVALTWQTVNAGVRQVFDGTGDWAWVRLLAMAEIKPLDSTRFELSWKQPEAETLRYVLRTQVGGGPLDLLALRGFKMPERIFVIPQGRPAVAPQGLTPVPDKSGTASIQPPQPPEGITP